MPSPDPTATCPCLSGQLYSRCCAPLHRGQKQAGSAEQLMRSRYSACALGLVDYLITTTQLSQRHLLDRAALSDWLSHSHWQRLEILATEAGGSDDSLGRVEFNAWYQLDGQGELLCHHESSRFIREAGNWVFVDPTVKPRAPGRNSPCPCGSGKKFKRCCADL
ncbi:YchJ family protein [Aestuariirhabdus litorea]|uniref:YchJ family protein n=1 Tax=Aestuariirhabdus litorea TaxID=2528527 RepID=A0A3P3VQ20_9GAMM|nr:YchJ family protein [Aestuariirhabdus litorea]RRJ84038.1 YchJ family protein [Aestuariirhabdus litorea]RWW97259.1 YchJ family protein [Endozoicomonadaceae bacterium GTF-13]